MAVPVTKEIQEIDSLPVAGFSLRSPGSCGLTLALVDDHFARLPQRTIE